jgi:L-rhamnose mutarotase
MRRLAFALDLQDDAALIAEYAAWHTPDRIPPAILESLRNSGLANLEIFCTGNRLFLLMDAPDEFSLDRKTIADAKNPAVQAWERLMGSFQKALPWAAPEQKWVPMESIFKLTDFPH